MKKTLFVLSLAMLVTHTAYADFYDIPDGIEKERIEYLEEKGVIKGVGDGRFEPERNVSRAEFTAMVNRAMGYDEKAFENNFTDVNESDWYYNDILLASKTGIIAGFPDGTFDPNGIITHEQAVKILVSIYENEYAVNPSGDMATMFDDYYEISDWARGYVSKGTMLSIAKGYGESVIKFKPQNYTTRLEAGDMLYSMLNALEISKKADIK